MLQVQQMQQGIQTNCVVTTTSIEHFIFKNRRKIASAVRHFLCEQIQSDVFFIMRIDIFDCR
jgi:hypothetical protein